LIPNGDYFVSSTAPSWAPSSLIRALSDSGSHMLTLGHMFVFVCLFYCRSHPLLNSNRSGLPSRLPCTFHPSLSLPLADLSCSSGPISSWTARITLATNELMETIDSTGNAQTRVHAVPRQYCTVHHMNCKHVRRFASVQSSRGLFGMCYSTLPKVFGISTQCPDATGVLYCTRVLYCTISMLFQITFIFCLACSRQIQLFAVPVERFPNLTSDKFVSQ